MQHSLRDGNGDIHVGAYIFFQDEILVSMLDSRGEDIEAEKR